VNFPHKDLLKPMINMISGIKPNYGVYLIPIVLVQEGLDMIHPLTYRRSCPSGRMTVHQDRMEDGVIHILTARINHPKHEMRPGITPNLDSNGTLMNNKFSSTRHPEYIIMTIIMVIRNPVTRVMVALWDCLLTEYPKPHLTVDYGIPSNTTTRYCSREFANL
jgi:hypothetical protein